MENIKEVTLVITSCNRLNLLKKTIESFEKYNTYPIKERIIIEDSGIETIYQELLTKYSEKFKIIFNSTPLKQIKSIDKAYSFVKTEYVFHCEDDWEFYRPYFIEDSLDILMSDSKIKQVGLRSIHHDLLKNHPSISINSKALVANSHRYYKYIMNNDFKEYDWITCSFNPGLLRKVDYDLIGTYNSQASSEAGISLWYKNRGFYSVVLENDAIKHIGWNDSSMGHYQPSYKFIIRIKNFIKAGFNLFGSNYSYN